VPKKLFLENAVCDRTNTKTIENREYELLSKYGIGANQYNKVKEDNRDYMTQNDIQQLCEKITKYKPKIIAFNGKTGTFLTQDLGPEQKKFGL